MADDQTNTNDAADERQTEPRRGLEGKGFDAGTGYGGAGNSSMYSGESSYGGQSGVGGSTTRGAYAGQEYGRSGEGEQGGAQGGEQSGEQNAARDTDGRGSANQSAAADTPRDADEKAVNDAFEGRGAGGGGDQGPDAIDLADMNGASRRDPVR